MVTAFVPSAPHARPGFKIQLPPSPPCPLPPFPLPFPSAAPRALDHRIRMKPSPRRTRLSVVSLAEDSPVSEAETEDDLETREADVSVDPPSSSSSSHPRPPDPPELTYRYCYVLSWLCSCKLVHGTRSRTLTRCTVGVSSEGRSSSVSSRGPPSHRNPSEAHPASETTPDPADSHRTDGCQQTSPRRRLSHM